MASMLPCRARPVVGARVEAGVDLARPPWGGPRGSLVALERVADEPEHRRPQPDEQRPALGVPALLLVDGLRPDPERDAEAYARGGRRLQVPAAQPGAVKWLGQHAARLPEQRVART